jgi:hypothetical protein
VGADQRKQKDKTTITAIEMTFMRQTAKHTGWNMNKRENNYELDPHMGQNSEI